MANTDIYRALPNNEVGLTLTTPATAWAYSPWKVVVRRIPRNINIIGLTYEANFLLSADDATNEQIFEIGIGNPSTAVTKLQLPTSWRADTRVGFYLTQAYNLFLPEPYTILEASTICVRVARGIAAAVTYNGIKILYQSNTALLNVSSNLNMNNYLFTHGLNSGGEVIR
jgi:hypothetical protein